MADDSRSERGFTIVDRRSSKGEESPSEPEAPQAEARSSEPRSSRDPGPLPGIDFASFALSLGTSALYHMGLVGDPEGGETAGEPNLPLARQTIDTLEMLEAKTRGNLDAEEARLLEGLLYELRMRFLEVSP